MIIDLLKDAITQNLGPVKKAPKGFLKRNCMMCHTQGHGRDIKNRFGIQFNPESIVMNCFNCGFSASYSEGKILSKSFKLFLRQLGVDDKFIKQIDFEVFKLSNQINAIRDGESLDNKEARLRSLFHHWKPINLPNDTLSVTSWLEAGCNDTEFLRVVEYALSRKIYDLENFYWSPETEFQINKRLIIPYYYKNQIVGYTARHCQNSNDKSIPRYYQQCPGDFVYNLDNQQDWSRKYVIVTEGVLDAYVVDGVSVLGEIGQLKIDIINKLQREIIVCPDRDKKGWDLVQAALDNNWAVSFPRWEKGIKDAAAAAEKYGRLLTTYSIIKSSVKDKDKIILKWRLDNNVRQR